MIVALAVVVVVLECALVLSWLRTGSLRSRLAAAEAAARTDPLTGLANRSGLSHAVRQASGSTHGLILFDLNGFKAINDRYGHGVGDRVLCDITGRICAHATLGSWVARLGGDEFAVLLTPAALAREDPLTCAHRIRTHIADPIAIGDSRVTVTASAGVATLPAESPEQLLLAADTAMYRAKRAQRDGLRTGRVPPARDVTGHVSIPSPNIA